MSTGIVIVGANGRMGRTISGLAAADPEYRLAGLVDSKEHLDALSGASCPVSDDLEALLRVAARSGHALVIGTTGFSEEEKEELRVLAAETPLFWSSNMSIGVNVLLKILPELTRALGDNYDIEMVELHHNRKKDSPSGTALTLGECLAEARGWELPDVRCSSRDGIIGERPRAQIGIQAIRGGDVVGVHTVYFMGPGERIEVSHQAHSRENFAQGALRAAAWLALQKPGRLYSMQDTF